MTASEKLVYEAIDAARRLDKLLALKAGAPRDLHAYIDMDRAIAEKQVAVQNVVDRMMVTP